MNFRNELAPLWADIMRTPVNAFFAGNEDLIADDSAGYGRIASPGYIGRDYRPGGWLLMGNFPAGGTLHYENAPDSGDKDLYDALETLQRAYTRGEVIQASTQLWDTWIRVQPNHRIYQTVVHPLLSALGMRDHDVAFINRFPFRVRGNSRVRVAMDDAAWRLAVERQIEAVQPGAIIALGVAAGTVLRNRYKGYARVWVLPRSNGDYSLTAGARDMIREIAQAAGTDKHDNREHVVPLRHTRDIAEIVDSKELIMQEEQTLSSSGSYVIERMLRELGFGNIEVGRVLRHTTAPIPSLYYNRDREGVVYFTGRKKDLGRYSAVVWVQVEPRQKKDRKPDLINMRLRQGKERAAFVSLLGSS